MVGHFPSPQATSHVAVPLYTSCFYSCRRQHLFWWENITVHWAQWKYKGQEHSQIVCPSTCIPVEYTTNADSSEHGSESAGRLKGRQFLTKWTISFSTTSSMELYIYIFKEPMMGGNRVSHSLGKDCFQNFHYCLEKWLKSRREI
jgi:hypothetical protein